MPAIKHFDTITEVLLDLLKRTKEGKIQLPDFQRSWVWNDEQIRSILASISLSYPVGVVMMLQTGNPNVRFEARPIEGVILSKPTEPERMILDGQQRLTSLFQALLLGKPVVTKDSRGKQIRRWYYIDISKAVDPNVERHETIISLSEDKILRNFFNSEVLVDCSTSEKEYENGLFPVAQIFDYFDWMNKYSKFWKFNSNKIELFQNFTQEIIKPFEQYQVPVILLKQETPREAVCQVFEKVNTGGVSLTVFELITATFAADNFNLREDWTKREKKLKKSKLGVLGNIQNTDFLQAVSLVATRDRNSGTISCTRKDILNLKLEEYNNWANRVTKGFEKAAKLLHTQKIFSARDLPYQPQLTALAAIFAVLEDEADQAGISAKLARWYWCGVFGEIYSSAIETRLAKDLPEVLSWIDRGSEPDTITSANFTSARLVNLRTRNSAAYKGLSALLMRDGAFDFRTGVAIQTQMYFDEKIDIHHIFPQKWCKDQSINPYLWNSILNKTVLSAKTNRIIGGKAPSIYLPKIQKQAGISDVQMEQILLSHVIEPTTLRADKFYDFLKAREIALLSLIAKAMGKSYLPSANSITTSSLEEDTELVEYDNEIDNDEDVDIA